MSGEGAPIQGIAVDAYTVPTEEPESDGTLEWEATTMVLATVEAGGQRYTYADTATAVLAKERLAPLLLGRNAFDIPQPVEIAEEGVVVEVGPVVVGEAAQLLQPLLAGV